MARGAGGTGGGSGRFLIGFFMMCGGFYLLLQSITVSADFGFGMSLYGGSMWGHTFVITSGMVMIPFVLGIAMVFYNARNLMGWLLSLGSLAAMIYGVIASTHFTLRTMTAFELITILVLCFGGLGLFLSSLRNLEKKLDDYESNGNLPMG
jgi:hypothetical protein